MRKIVVYIFLSLLFFSSAIQAQEKGIVFGHYKDWEEVLEQARKENKFIFVDCYTTWCVPCKMMSSDVFPLENVGTFMNAQFISVKLQMDTAKVDNDTVKSWYGDAAMLAKTYKIKNYPTFLYFDPQGNQVHRTVGMSSPDGFIKNSGNALNPETQYLRMQEKYLPGGENSSVLLRTLATAAWAASEEAKSRQFAAEYLKLTSDNELLTKENIDFVRFNTRTSTDRGFAFFLRNEAKVDQISGKGTAAEIIRWTIMKELKARIAVSSQAPNWKVIYADLKKRIPKYADEFTIKGKINFYEERRNWALYCANVSALLPHYGSMMTAQELNNYVYQLFMSCHQKQYLAEALKWSDRIMLTAQDNTVLYTRASLLYKMGRKKEAIPLMKKGIAMATDEDKSGMQEMLEMMQQGKKLWED